MVIFMLLVMPMMRWMKLMSDEDIIDDDDDDMDDDNMDGDDESMLVM